MFTTPSCLVQPVLYSPQKREGLHEMTSSIHLHPTAIRAYLLCIDSVSDGGTPFVTADVVPSMVTYRIGMVVINRHGSD